jgi:Fur family transcriptional regulator, ferric uptake regulator
LSEKNHTAQHEELLRTAKTKVTKPRLAVLKCLGENDNPLNPKEILSIIKSDSELEQTDLVTIYRILDTFSKLELVHQVHPSGGYLICGHPSCSKGTHILLTCNQCEQAIEVEIPNEIFSATQWYIESKFNFEINKHLFQIDGLCKSCKKTSKP